MNEYTRGYQGHSFKHVHVYRRQEQPIQEFYLKRSKRRMLYNMEQIKNNATLQTHEIIYQGYRDHSFKYVHVYVKSKLYNLVEWVAFPCFAKRIKYYYYY